MHLTALRPWFNGDHEGRVEPGQSFEASEYRAKELIRAGLAIMAALPETTKIKVPSDPPRVRNPIKRRP
jgi:hypothetical protein